MGGKNIQEPGEELDDLAKKTIGAAIEVHRALGPGYLESLYEEALAIEFELRGIPFVRQFPVAAEYKGHKIGEGKLDFLVDGKPVVELKAVEKLTDIHTAQVISYLRMTGLELGLLLNFNVDLLKKGIRRVILS